MVFQIKASDNRDGATDLTYNLDTLVIMVMMVVST